MDVEQLLENCPGEQTRAVNAVPLAVRRRNLHYQLARTRYSSATFPSFGFLLDASNLGGQERQANILPCCASSISSKAEASSPKLVFQFQFSTYFFPPSGFANRFIPQLLTGKQSSKSCRVRSQSSQPSDSLRSKKASTIDSPVPHLIKASIRIATAVCPDPRHANGSAAHPGPGVSIGWHEYVCMQTKPKSIERVVR